MTTSWFVHQAEARAALRAAEKRALQYFMAGETFPAAWVSYVAALNAIANATTVAVPGVLPVAPA